MISFLTNRGNRRERKPTQNIMLKMANTLFLVNLTSETNVVNFLFMPGDRVRGTMKDVAKLLI